MSEEAKTELTIEEQIANIKDTPEMAAILNQHAKTYHQLKAEETGASYMGKAYNNVDTAYMEGLGLKERPTGKTSELILTLAKDKIALEAKLASTSTTEVDTEKDAEKQKLHDSRVSNLEAQLTELTKTNESLSLAKKNQAVQNALSKETGILTLNPAISETVLGEVLDSRTKKIVQNSKEIEGRTVYYNESGDPYTNLNGLPMSAKEVVGEVFKDLVYTKPKGGNTPEQDKPVVKGDIMVLPNTQMINNFEDFRKEFSKAMASKGWASHEERYIKLQKSTQDHYFPKGLTMG